MTAPRLTRFDGRAIFDFLASRGGPVMEIDLLRELTGERRMPEGRTALFAIHFSLYHALYLLRDEAGAEGYYLHLDPMRIRLARMPGARECHHFNPDTGTYCAEPADGGFCGVHLPDGLDMTAPSFDPLRDFYVNPSNISFGSEALLAKLMRGVIYYALRRGEVEHALSFFSLARPNRRAVTKRYHEMAKRYHPDRNGGDDSLMKELNRSYQVLMEVFVI